MTKFEMTLNEVQVLTINNHPVRCIPVEELWGDCGQSGDWHGWDYQVYKTKTGKYIAGFVSWSSVQGERDYLHLILAENPKDLLDKLDAENFVHQKLARKIAAAHEVVPTI